MVSLSVGGLGVSLRLCFAFLCYLKPTCNEDTLIELATSLKALLLDHLVELKMFCEDKAMASQSPSPKVTMTGISSSSGIISINSDREPTQALDQQTGASHGHVAILWDIENCPVPSDVRPEDVAGNIRIALRVHPFIRGAVTVFSAYGDFNAFPRRLREGCQRTGVKLVDIPNTRKDAADKAILVDMFLFALDNQPPSSIMLISGDVDFAPALHILGQRGYTIILVIPSGVGVSSALRNAGQFVWDWPCVVRGEGFVPPKTFPHGYIMNFRNEDNPDMENGEETIVYQGLSISEDPTWGNFNQAYSCMPSQVSRERSGASQSSEYNINNLAAGSCFTSSRCESLPSVQVHQNSSLDQDWWVQPGDLHGLKGQIVRLLEMSGGSLPLIRVPSEYLKVFRRPLYVSEYGAYKLVNLFQKMADALFVVGKGHRKLLCLHNSAGRHIKRCLGSPAMVMTNEKGKRVPEESIDISTCPQLGSFSDESLEDEKNDDFFLGSTYDFEDQLTNIRQETQELLVCYSCPIPLGAFAALYEQRYKKVLDYQSFGVDCLEQLIEKMRDVVKLREDRDSKKKFLVSSFLSR
ncbi:unnamed protein product [Musa acuminata subsp. malaccensis]|nr:PREDICTED: uncharacterized protein LOC103989003 isoform X1 [Musa acuminata subsp. malaccensis]XP_018683866.1 PREDICTED: uncharacterized protein LOC103989003 isoform X1 [Musa acuminata subsp. malaccensis]XP_018683867.1 PREDICTED: uncharacterized protein LOC103989003 isoform X1 [Musa acuminata subsp. malaccensis]CAG1847463.1 unnamed protein product [Musa acuminata subsp. malaccensis]